jgi:hypothetical protein
VNSVNSIPIGLIMYLPTRINLREFV